MDAWMKEWIHGRTNERHDMHGSEICNLIGLVCLFWNGELKKKRFDKKKLWYLVNIFSLDVRNKSLREIKKNIRAIFRDICGKTTPSVLWWRGLTSGIRRVCLKQILETFLNCLVNSFIQFFYLLFRKCVQFSY